MSGSVVLLSGGVGGAKLALGLDTILPAKSLNIIANIGDDFDHFGLRICPDIDTLLYTLAGLANAELGWGRAGESWSFMEAIKSLNGEEWFNLGDGDLALHVLRTVALAGGSSLTDITARVAARWGIASAILPVSDDPLRTIVKTPEGEIGFQDYFVRLRCVPSVQALRFSGAETAQLSPAVVRALAAPQLEAIILAPSNPYLSIDPVLAVPGLSAALRGAGVPIVAVSPIIAGQAVKGPTAKIMREMGVETTVGAIAAHYDGLIDGLLIDQRDAGTALPSKLTVRTCDIMMTSLDDRQRVAQAALDLARACRSAQR